MAANDISIRFASEGEATLRSAVSAIDAQMRALNEQLKASTAGMQNLSTQEDASAKRTEALNGIIAASQEKLRLLGSQYDEAKAKLASLAEEMQRAQQSGDPVAIDKATTAYNRQSVEVSKLEGSMAKAEGEIAKATTAMSQSGNESDGLKEKIGVLAQSLSINLAQEALGKVISGMEAMGRAVIDAGKKVWDMASDASTFADDLLTLSTQTGISAEKLQEYAYASRFVDTEVSTLTSSMTKMIRSMSSSSKDTQAAFKSLGVATRDELTGSMRDAEDVFWDAIDALGKVQNATERDQLAMQIFGRSAQELNPLITAGSTEWRKYADEAHKAGLILSDDSVGALGSFNDGLQRIDATMEAAQRQIMGALAPAFQTIADAVTEAAQRFTQWVQTDEAKAYLAELQELIANVASSLLSNLGPAIDGGIELFKSVGGAIKFASDNFDLIVSGIKAAVAVFVTLKGTMAALQIAALVTNPIGQVIAVVGSLVAAITLLVTNWDRVKQAGAAAWNGIKSAWNAAGSWFSQIGTSIYNSLNKVAPNIANVFKTAWSAVQTAWSAATGYFSSIWSSIKGVFSAVQSVLRGDFQGAWDAIKGIVGTWVSYFQQTWNNIKNVFANVGTTLSGFFSSAWNGIKNVWNAVGSWFKNVVTTIINAFTSVPQRIQQFFTSAWNGVKSAWGSATSFFSQIGSKIISAISSSIGSLPSKAMQWGRDMMEGFGKGISGFMSKVTQPVKDLANKIKSFLHFSRPDVGPLRDYETWMPDFVSGLASSLTRSQPVLEHAVANMAGRIESQVKGMKLSASATQQAQPPIVLQVDGKTFARLMTPYIDSQQGSNWGTRMALGLG